MLLKDLRQKKLPLEKEIIINKTVKIRENDVHLISITFEEHRNVLWAMYQSPHDTSPHNTGEATDFSVRTEPATNRDKLLTGFSRKTNFPNMYLPGITIQGQTIPISSSGTKCLSYMEYKEYILFQHFIETGMIPAGFDEADLTSIFLASYELEKTEESPEIDLDRKPDMTLKVGKEIRQVPANQQMRVEFGEMEKGRKFYFYDVYEDRNRAFYLDKLEHFDIWEEAKHRYTDEWTKALPGEQVVRMKEQYLAHLERICPKGMDLAVLEYEVEDGAQLDFYARDYLEERPSPDASSGFMIFLGSDKQPGMNGFHSRKCILKPVEKNFNGSMDIELFSWYKEIPEEIITVFQ